MISPCKKSALQSGSLSSCGRISTGFRRVALSVNGVFGAPSSPLMVSEMMGGGGGTLPELDGRFSKSPCHGMGLIALSEFARRREGRAAQTIYPRDNIGPMKVFEKKTKLHGRVLDGTKQRQRRDTTRFTDNEDASAGTRNQQQRRGTTHDTHTHTPFLCQLERCKIVHAFRLRCRPQAAGCRSSFLVAFKHGGKGEGRQAGRGQVATPKVPLQVGAQHVQERIKPSVRSGANPQGKPTAWSSAHRGVCNATHRFLAFERKWRN